MQLFLNDLSLHGQFSDLHSFCMAIDRVMAMRPLVRRYGREIHCHRNMARAQVTQTLTMHQAVARGLSVDQRRALLQWLDRQGPFWEDVRHHGPGEYLECDGHVVTDSAVGEAAHCCLVGMERQLVSITPSSWTRSPLIVTFFPDEGGGKNVDVVNHWTGEGLETALQATPAPVASWEQLARVSVARFPDLTFSEDSFDPLRGHPFVEGAAHRVLVLLDTLQRLMACRDLSGQFNDEGQRIYQEHFTGRKAWFSGSSDTEERDFRTELTFCHPNVDGEYLFCPWHGKVKTPQLRIHFTWPVPAGASLFVVYVGPKITKK